MSTTPPPKLTAKEANEALQKIRDILWLDEDGHPDPDAEWSADTTADIAAIFYDLDLGPEERNGHSDGKSRRRPRNAGGDMTVANTIREQLGRMALVMLGASDFVYDESSLQFSIKGSRVANKVRIVLDPDDTYTVEFWKGRGIKMARVSEFDGVYADQLHDLIESETGLYTSLKPRQGARKPASSSSSSTATSSQRRRQAGFLDTIKDFAGKVFDGGKKANGPASPAATATTALVATTTPSPPPPPRPAEHAPIRVFWPPSR